MATAFVPGSEGPIGEHLCEASFEVDWDAVWLDTTGSGRWASVARLTDDR